MNYSLKKIQPYIIFSAKMGSHAYGTNIPESDIDIRGIFVQPLDDILKYGYHDQVSDEKNDIIYYELKRFLELLEKNNPNILELLAAPEDCILIQDPLYDLIKSQTSKFITKRCRWTFAGYAIEQIQKARGYNKKMNWEENEMVRKSVLDFCYILSNNDAIPYKTWIKSYIRENRGVPLDDDHFERFVSTYQKRFGLAKIDHAHDLYAMYDLVFSYDENLAERAGGIVSDEETANDVRLVSIPKDVDFTAYLTFNKDAYSTHCKKFKEYQTWLKERNVNRVKMNKAHGKNYDSKNMMHVFRLLKMALEIANGELNVRRSPEEIKTLMKIRYGEYEYDDLLNESEAMIASLDKAFDESSLPSSIEKELIPNIELEIRKKIYKI